MSHRLVIVLTCDHRAPEGRCRAWFMGPSSTDIAGVREAAAAHHWTFKPGVPHPHIQGEDLCREH